MAFSPLFEVHRHKKYSKLVLRPSIILILTKNGHLIPQYSIHTKFGSISSLTISRDIFVPVDLWKWEKGHFWSFFHPFVASIWNRRIRCLTFLTLPLAFLPLSHPTLYPPAQVASAKDQIWHWSKFSVYGTLGSHQTRSNR